MAVFMKPAEEAKLAQREQPHGVSNVSNGDMESACSLPLRLGSFGLKMNLLLNLGENALPLT